MTARYMLWLLLSTGSLVIMILVDYALGPNAEFLNAWSVVERLRGLPSTVNSLAYREFGATGELICVLLANVSIGGVLVSLTYLFNYVRNPG